MIHYWGQIKYIKEKLHQFSGLGQLSSVATIGFPANETFREKMRKKTKILSCISQTFSRNFAFFRENK